MEFGKKIRDIEFCALDFETTGLNPLIDRMVEVGIVRFTMDEVLDTYQSLVNPQRDIPGRVSMIHGITADMVQQAPMVRDILDEVAGFIGNSILIIQNSRFDLSIMDAAYRSHDLKTPSMMSFDTLTLARKAFPHLPNYKLGTLCDSFNIPIRAHRALSDAYGCMDVFRNVIREVDPSGRWSLRDLHKYHGKMVTTQSIRPGKKRNPVDSRIPIGHRITIQYRDVKGNISTRSILPRRFLAQGDKDYVHAYCYLREDDRFFNTANILNVQ